MSESATGGEDEVGGGYWEGLREAKQTLVPVGEAIAEERGPISKLIVRTEGFIGNPWFYLVLLVGHLAWVVLNAGWIEGIEPWDPYPFTFLATIASVEAPFITLMVLMAQRRQRAVQELREEVDVQVALHNERQLTELVRMIERMRQHLGVEPGPDEERIQAMERDLDPRRLLEEVRGKMDESEGQDPNRS